MLIEEVLEAGGLSPKDCPTLVRACLQSSSHADRIAVAFRALKNAGATLDDHLGLYEECAKYASYANNFADVFNILQDIGATLQDHLDLYTSCIEHAYYATNLAIAFKSLKETGFTPNGSPDLYKSCILFPSYAERLAKAFNTLTEAGLTQKDYPTLYEGCIKHPSNADKVATAFKVLKGTGITHERSPALYEACIQQPFCGDNLALAFKSLQAAGLRHENYPSLYEASIKEPYHAVTFAKAFNLLKDAGFTLKEHQVLYDSCIQQSAYADKLARAFTSLKDAGAILIDHLALYEASISYVASIKVPSEVEKLPIAFKALKATGVTPKDHPAFYQLCIKHARNAEKFAAVFHALKDAGLTVKDHLVLYELCIQKASYAQKFAMAFEFLKDAGFNPEDYPAIYEMSILKAYNAENFDIAFNALKKVGATRKDHLVLYESSINQAYYARLFATAFKALKDTGITLEEYPALYKVSINHPISSDLFANVFKALNDAGVTPKEHQALYEASIQNARFDGRFAMAFKVLKAAEATIQEHPALYLAVIQNIHGASVFDGVFKALKDVGATPKDHQVLYVESIRNVSSSGKFKTVFTALQDVGATVKEHSVLYEFVVKTADVSLSCLNKLRCLGLQVPDHLNIVLQILSESKLALEVLTWLETKRLTSKSHDFIYEACFVGETALLHSPYNFSKVTIKLEQYFEHHALCSVHEKGYPAQRQEIQALLNEVLNEDITEGPLNKSPETRDMEVLLHRMAIETMENMTLRYDESLGYMLQFGDEPEIYLSELLRGTNFNHISLSKEQVALLGDKIEALSLGFLLKNLPSSNRIVRKLPDAARSALDCYFGDYYKNINRLFRGVRLTEEVQYKWLIPVHEKNNLMVNFLAGALVNWAAAELPRILVGTPERIILEKILNTKENAVGVMKCMQQDKGVYETTLKESLSAEIITQEDYDKIVACFDELTVLFPIYGLVDRGEDLEAALQEGELGTTESRLANPIVASSVMSFSAFPDGVSHFHYARTKRTKLETPCSTRPVAYHKEAEILIPQGATYCYTANPAGGFFAREVNSPGIVPGGGHWSATALAEAYRNHLSKCYKETSDQITLNNKIVYRPNHGLAHTYRVMLYIDVVIDYVAHHAEDLVFRLFCQDISSEEREWLRVAAAYSVSGRESEIAAVDNLKQYEAFREASMSHMAAFLDRYPPKNSNAPMQERMLDIVHWMGNPGYETACHDQAPINKHPDPVERSHRNYIHRVLMLAHKLDLPRCYSPKQFTTAMKPCLAFFKESLEQQADYLRMVRYAIELNKAHGNALCTDLSYTGELLPCAKRYRSPFAEVSTNLGKLKAMTDTVPRIKCREPYQFPVCEHEKRNKRACKLSVLI